jgi:hypothetical protein
VDGTVSGRAEGGAPSQPPPVSDLLRACGFDTLGQDPPPEAVENVLVTLAGMLNGASPLHRELVREAALKKLKAAGILAPGRVVDAALAPPEPDGVNLPTISTEPPEIVDVVDAGEEAGLAYVVADRGSISVVDEWQGMRPWPRERIPYEPIPHVADFQAAVDAGAFPVAHELADRLLRAVVLPTPRRAWAYLLAAWDHGTYLLEFHDYYPLLLLEGPPERGKTRLGKLLTYAARRGYYTPTPRGPTLVRDRSFHSATLMIDVEDLGRVLERGGELADLILASFERGARVRLVVRPDAPPEHQMESYSAYGPTILLTNRPMRAESPLASRCIRVPLPEAGTTEVPPATRPDDVAELRARMVAWAARIRAGGAELPEVEVPFRGRLRDMALPLLRVLKLIAPDHVDEVVELLTKMDENRRSESARFWEARVAVALWEARDRVEGGRLYVKVLTEVVNEGAEETDRLTPQQVGTARRNLGLTGGKGGDPPGAYVVWPGDEAARALHNRYAPPPDGSDPEGSEGSEGTVEPQRISGLPTSKEVGRVGREEAGRVGRVGRVGNPHQDFIPADPADASGPLQAPARGVCPDCGADIGPTATICAACRGRG